MASLWSLLLSKSFQSLLCVLLTHMADPLTPQDEKDGGKKKKKKSQDIFITQSQDQKKADRKTAEQPGAKVTWGWKRNTGCWVITATPAVFSKLWPHHALYYQWGCNFYTHTDTHTPPSCLSVLVVNFPLTSSFKGQIWSFHAFCH